MLSLVDRRHGQLRLRVVATERADGDVHPKRVEPNALIARQRAVSGSYWSMLDQVHGTVVRPASPGPDLGPAGDVIVTDAIGRHVAIWAADCAPLLLATDQDRLVGAHAGWRGLADGVVEVACQAAEAGGGRITAAVIGPTVGPCCYAFGEHELAAVARGVVADPDDVAGTTADGALALDVPAAVAAALARHGVDLDVVGPCTGCDRRWFSHRVRRDPERQATVAWLEAWGA